MGDIDGAADPMEQSQTPYISSISHQMYKMANTDQEATTQRILRQIAETREVLRVYGGFVPASDRLKDTLQECIKRKKKGREGKAPKAALAQSEGGPSRAAAKSEDMWDSQKLF